MVTQGYVQTLSATFVKLGDLQELVGKLHSELEYNPDPQVAEVLEKNLLPSLEYTSKVLQWIAKRAGLEVQPVGR